MDFAVVAGDAADDVAFRVQFSLMGMTATTNQLSCTQAIGRREAERQQRLQEEEAERQRQAQLRAQRAEAERIERQRRAEETARSAQADRERQRVEAEGRRLEAERRARAPKLLLGGEIGVGGGLNERTADSFGLNVQLGLSTGINWGRVTLTLRPLDMMMLADRDLDDEWVHRMGGDLRVALGREARLLVGAGAVRHGPPWSEPEWMPYLLLTWGARNNLPLGFDLRVYQEGVELSFAALGVIGRL